MLLRNDVFKAKLYRQYKLETSVSNDVKIGDRKFKNRNEIKKFLSDCELSDFEEYWNSIKETIDKIYVSQASTSILKSEDMEMLGRMNFYLDFLAEAYIEVKQERKESFDNMMNSPKLTLLEKVELCEIVLANSAEYEFDIDRIEKANRFLIRYYEGGVLSRIDQERAEVEEVLKSEDERVIRFLEKIFAEGRRSYHDNKSLERIQARLQSIVRSLSSDFSNLNNAEAVLLFNKTLARIITPAIEDIIRRRLLSSVPNKDLNWDEINGMISVDIAARLKFVSGHTFPENFIPQPAEENLVENPPVQNAASGQDDDNDNEKQPAPIGTSAALRSRPKIGHERKPQTRKPMSERYKQKNGSEEVIVEQETQPAPQPEAPVERAKKAARPVSMFVGDAKAMQGALAAATSATLRSSGSAATLSRRNDASTTSASSSSSTSLRNNVPQIDLRNIIESIKVDVIRCCSTNRQIETLQSAIACIAGMVSISQFFRHVGSVIGKADYYNQLAVRIESDPQLILQLRDVINNTVQNLNTLSL